MQLRHNAKMHRFLASSVSALLAANVMVLVIGLADDVADADKADRTVTLITTEDGKQIEVDPNTPEGQWMIAEAEQRGDEVVTVPQVQAVTTTTVPGSTTTTVPAAQRGTTVPPIVGDVRDTVEDTVNQVTDTVDETVDQVGDTVDDTVDDVTDIVDDTAGTDTGDVDDAVDDTTDTVSDTVDDVTDVVDDTADDVLDVVDDDGDDDDGGLTGGLGGSGL